MMSLESTLHRIGGVSSLSGVPVPTLRVWESRYAAFNPQKTGGRHRLYTDDDVLRATLLRQLTDAGHAISTVANLEAAALTALLQQQRAAQQQRVGVQANERVISLAVIGVPLAARVQSAPMRQSFSALGVQVADSRKDVDDALAQAFDPLPDIVLVQLNTVHQVTQAALGRLKARYRNAQVIVLYRFGPEAVIDALTQTGIRMRREPLPDAELADLVRSLLLVDARPSTGSALPPALIPARRYRDETLAQLAAISSRLHCECPRHVAELITQLASFEQYSQECLNRSAQDAQLHAQLSAISGSARALMEQALDMVARHEGISLGD